jgi:nicotinic acid mononucleotide adenylyltransferase
LAALAEFVVIPRPGEAAQALPAPFCGQYLRGFPLGVSSSQIRERIRNRLSIRGLVPDAVGEAIHNSALYL